MSFYRDYSNLAESLLYDNLVYQYILSLRWYLLFFCTLSGLFISMISVASIYLRTIIPDINLRRSLAWITILVTYLSGAWSWCIILLLIEAGREFIRFGIPKIMATIATFITEEPDAETLLRRLFRLLRVCKHQPVGLTSQQLLLHIINYRQGDHSEQFTPEERNKFRKLFQDFIQTSFLVETSPQAFTIFFPSFVVRIHPHFIHFTKDEAIKLIRNGESDELCPICHETFNKFYIQLKCKHKYCVKCILRWLNQAYSCPICRVVIN